LLVVDVVVQALKESMTLVLDHVVDTEDHVIALAKTLIACTVVRGAQLSIVRKLESQSIIDIHTALISWIVKRIAAYETTKNKRDRQKSILFFKALQHLLTAIDPADALKIKTHLEKSVADAKLEIPPSSKRWDPYRSYEKKLSKDKATGGTKGGQRGKRKETHNPELTTDDDEEGEVEGIVVTNGQSSQPMPRLQLKSTTTHPTQQSDAETEEPQLSQPPELPENHASPSIVSPPRPSGSGTAAVEHSSPSHEQSSPLAPSLIVPNGTSTPRGVKRSRQISVSDLESAEENVDQYPDTGDGDPTQSSDIVVRRKRVRH